MSHHCQVSYLHFLNRLLTPHRKAVFGKASDKKNYSNTKEYVRAKVDELYPLVFDDMPRMKRDHTRLSKQSEDIYDAIVIALSYYK